MAQMLRRRLIFAGLVGLLTGCYQAPAPGTATPRQPEVTVIRLTPTPAPTATPLFPPGLSAPDMTSGGLVALRFDPARYTFRAHYTPGEARTLRQWREALPQALAIINANFYDVDNSILGLLVSDGLVYGRSYVNRGGTFGLLNGEIVLRSNIRQPYRDEPYTQAAQAFPMLVLDGQASYQRQNDRAIARRTVVALDAEGQVWWLATPGFGLTLSALSRYLANAAPNFVSALNLDGGGSTMMYLAPTDYHLLSRDPVPAVLALYAR